MINKSYKMDWWMETIELKKALLYKLKALKIWLIFVFNGK